MNKWLNRGLKQTFFIFIDAFILSYNNYFISTLNNTIKGNIFLNIFIIINLLLLLLLLLFIINFYFIFGHKFLLITCTKIIY